MIKAKVQLFDDASGKDIGDQKIVSPKGCTFYYLPNEEPTVEFDFNFRTKNPANLFNGLDFKDQEWSYIKVCRKNCPKKIN